MAGLIWEHNMAKGSGGAGRAKGGGGGTARAEWDKAVKERDQVVREMAGMRKPSSEQMAFGTSGRSAADPERVAAYDASVKEYNRKHSKLSKRAKALLPVVNAGAAKYRRR